MAEKDKQHIVSKTYLKNFVIPDYKHPNHVWCLDLFDSYKKYPIPKGTNQDIFKIKNFYSLNDKNNRLLLENFYAEKLEPLYNQIIHEVNLESNLSEIIRLRLIEWLMHSNIKTEHFRKNIERLAAFLIDIHSNFGNQKQIFTEKYTADSSRVMAKEIQLETILNPDDFSGILELFYNELVTKKWTILKSKVDTPFIANDNPGFSLNTSNLGLNKFNSTIQLKSISFNYFVLSPIYCLFIEPFKKTDRVELNAMNLEIKYNEISSEEINFINEGTFNTSLRYIISNNFNTINKWTGKLG
tara:strand:- start:1512 stop:2408 length:897 start_codon:yes stop_codon:yes gene_type:complete